MTIGSRRRTGFVAFPAVIDTTVIDGTSSAFRGLSPASRGLFFRQRPDPSGDSRAVAARASAVAALVHDVHVRYP